MIAESTETTFKALVTDDDPIVRRMVMFALKQQGFVCESAEDGDEAMKMIDAGAFDLLVTDLRMPNKNGHALSVEVLQSETRPAIVVHTSVEDPRLTKDLMLRGVDDVVYKPANYVAFAAKARGLVERRRETAASGARRRSDDRPKDEEKKDAPTPEAENIAENIEAERAGDEPAADGAKPASEAATKKESGAASRVSQHRVLGELTKLEGLFPLSSAAFDVYSLASRSDAEPKELAEAIERDASLMAETLRLANSALMGSVAGPIETVEKAIVRLGRKQIGELALAVGGRRAAAEQAIPWVNRSLLWERSLAAGICISTMQPAAVSSANRSLFLCSILHPVGRVVLATLFPDEHRALVERCRANGDLLDEQEEKTFGINHGQIGARLLSAWHIPSDIRAPLERIGKSFDELSASSDQSRLRAAALKTAIFVGSLAVGEWEPFDSLDAPRPLLLKQLGVGSLESLLETVAKRLESVGVETAAATTASQLNANGEPVAMRYCLPEGDDGFDPLALIIRRLGVELHDEADATTHVTLVNGLSSTSKSLEAYLAREQLDAPIGFVHRQEDVRLFGAGRALCFPASFAGLQRFLQR